MLRILALLVIASFLITGCSGVDVYTFKKERVDQTIRGNEGYVQGEKLETTQEDLNRKRTLIGVDIDVSGIGSGKEEETATTETVQETKPVTKTKAEPVVKETVVEETEEDWIK